MGEHITGRLVQTSQTNQYLPGEQSCDCFYCTAFTEKVPCQTTQNIQDWEIGTNSCCSGFCTSQPTCAKPERAECDIGRSSNDLDPLISFGWDREAPNLKCVYNLDDIDTRAQVLAYQDKFGENSDIEAKYCIQKVSECPEGMNECSRLKSIGEGGNECRVWFESQEPNIKDATILNYCLLHNTEDCKCVNRADDPVYQSAKAGHSINDGCWYTACAGSGKYLVPSQLANPTCPDKMCQVLYDIYQDGNVDLDNIQNDIVCQFDDSGPVEPPAPPVVPTEQTFFEKYMYQLMGAGGLLLVLLIVMMSSRRRDDR